jgi:hypothetical protein
MSQSGIKPTRVRVLIVLLCACLSACTTVKGIINPSAQVDYKKGYDFDHIEKVAIAPCGYSGFRPAVLSEEQEDRITLALSRALTKQGLDVVEMLSDADAVLDWHVVTEERSEVRSYNAQSYYQCWRCGPALSGKSVTTYTQGTFIVDIIDPALSKSVWRGVINGRLTALADMALQQEQVDAAADEILSRFPPGIFIDGLY